MMRPDNGKPEPDTHKTEVKLVYNDDAIYTIQEPTLVQMEDYLFGQTLKTDLALKGI